MRIGIAGVGGIGSNVAVNLVRSGIKNIKFGDFDKIDSTNLNRQFYFHDQLGLYKADALYTNLMKIDNTLCLEKSIIIFDDKNLKEYFSDCQIIIEGFDNIESKTIFMETFLNTDKIIVSASGIAGIDTSKVVVKKFGRNSYIVGDFKSDIKYHKVYSHKVQLIACKMAEIVFKEVNDGI